MITQEIRHQLNMLADPQRAKSMQRYFKTGPKDYGAGDIFIGISVPVQRQVAKKYATNVSLSDIESLLDDEIHEHRLTALFLLVHLFERRLRQNDALAKECVDFYIRKLDRVNNWDLVDSSAHLILGRWLFDKDRSLLYELAVHDGLWQNRVAMVATWYFIRKNEVGDVLDIAGLFMNHTHDLIHKATGWMLREAWKKKPGQVEAFLKTNAQIMPRVMLRYALEKVNADLKNELMTAGQFRVKRK